MEMGAQTQPETTTPRASSTKKGLNFIDNGLDKVDRFLHGAVAWGLGIAVFLVVVIVGTSIYQYKLQQDLNVLNTKIEAAANDLRSQQEFENRFLTVQEKLDTYAQMSDSEKVIDLFPILSELVPPQVQVKDLILEPGRAEIVALAMDRSAFELFVSNLRLADGRTFNGNQRLSIIDPSFTDIAQTTNSELTTEGYEASLSFSYRIE